MHTVFVYGTLRTGASNAFRMKGARSLGEATVSAQLYRVHDQFPGIVLGEGSVLHGEIFTDVSDHHLHALDVYEGCDDGLPVEEHLYRRVEVDAVDGNGDLVRCYIWEYVKPIADSPLIPEGDWLEAQH